MPTHNILRKLTTSKWRASPYVLRATALALSFSAAGYACPVWERLAHANHLDPVLNESCRLTTGCLKPTNTSNLHLLTGIVTQKHAEKLLASKSAHNKYVIPPLVVQLQARPTKVTIKKKLSAQCKSSRREDYNLERGSMGKKVGRVAIKQSFTYPNQ